MTEHKMMVSINSLKDSDSIYNIIDGAPNMFLRTISRSAHNNKYYEKRKI
jgi:hypothetical protein